MYELKNIEFSLSALNNGKEEVTIIGSNPYYTYENGVCTDKVEGYKYLALLTNQGNIQINVKIPGQRLLPDAGPIVTAKFVGFKANFYVYKGNLQLKAIAESLQVVK